MKIHPVLSILVMPFYWMCVCNYIFVVSGLCHDNQRSLLLQLKNNLTYPEIFSRMKLWNQSIACCNWSGVTCDEEGHVTGLDLSYELISGGFDNSSSLFSLQHLRILNLAFNNFNSVIPSGFNKLEKLTYLNLSNAGFVGQIPIEIFQLTRLVTLDISSLAYLTGQELKLENLLSSLTRLQNLSVIRLDWNNLSSPVPETFANFKNLTVLSLRDCELMGTFPQKIFQVETLSVIDISYNPNLHGSFPDFPLNGSLQAIIVRLTSFSGALPHSIGNMMQLSTLDLSICQFNGTLPNSLSNLTELSYLDLSDNSFTGPIPSFGMAKNLSHMHLSNNDLSGEIPSAAHFEGLQNLVSIDLSSNSINGSIPSSLFTLPSLQRIQLSYNQFNQLDEFTNVYSSILNTLDLRSNNLSGPIPESIFQLRSLGILQLSTNKFNGSVQLSKLLELRNLTTLHLSYNNLSVNVNVTNADLSSFPNITDLHLASCNLKTFPGFLRNQSSLILLDLSENQIQGVVPNWIWKLESLISLNISHNLLTDFEGPLQNLSSNLLVLDLHYNQLQGPPVFPTHAAILDYSSNKFSSVIPQDIGNYLSKATFLSLSNNTFLGSISDSFCSASKLLVLDISLNNFSGTIPSCLMTMTETLWVLNLRKNNLTGHIPDMFPASCALMTLDLRGNVLDGQIPKSLANCTKLEVLNLERNQIIDRFPCMLKNISTLRVLVLRENKFHGPIGCPNTTCTWHMLQIVDLAFNNFNGTLHGKCFTTWEAMMHDEHRGESEFEVFKFNQVNFQDSVTVTTKGQQIELVKIRTIFTSIDFSSNQFQGEIPEELMKFKALHVLNLSNNAFSGQIPSSIGNLKEVESLDLSNNSLEGKIPNELASLNFLSVLNLSFNQLLGRIPTGTQIQSFPETSFIGNKGLCGPPLTTNCTDNMLGPSPLPTCGRLACAVDLNFLSVELGFTFGIGMVIVPLLFWKQWRVWYWQLLDKILCWIFPQLYLDYVRRGGNRYAVLRWRR